MRHTFIDKYAYGDSPIHRLNPKFKLSFTLVSLFMLIMVTEIDALQLYQWKMYGIFLTLMGIMLFISKIPICAILKKMVLVLPFVFFILLLNLAVGMPIERIIQIGTRTILSVLTLVMLISTTKFHSILVVLKGWHIPGIIVQTLAFIYRYFFILIDEAQKMVNTFRLRGGGLGRWQVMKIMSAIIGNLFIRSYERAERVFWAMTMRSSENENL